MDFIIRRASRPFPSVPLARAAACAILLALPCTTGAATIYYEGFAYGASNGSLTGLSGGTGFSAGWIAGNPGMTYSSTGLAFSDLVVTGGSAFATGGIGNAYYTRALTATLGGTYYGSFLTEVITATGIGIKSGMDVGPAGAGPGTSNSMGALAPFNQTGLAAAAGNSVATNGPFPNVGQVYLVLFKIDTATKTTIAWLLTEAQFDTFKVGGLTEAELNAAALGPAANQLWARATRTAAPFSLTASNLTIYMNDIATLGLDEFRLSDAGLDEVTPVTPGACCHGAVCTITDKYQCTGAWLGKNSICSPPVLGGTVNACCKADFNNSGGVSVQDIFDFLAAYFTGCG